jgi:putative transposase
VKKSKFPESQIANILKEAEAGGASAGAINRLARKTNEHSHGHWPQVDLPTVRRQAQEKHVELLHIQPGRPAQNAYIERFKRTYREDVLYEYLLDDLREVRHITEHWLGDYNTIHPHRTLQGLGPRQFALQLIRIVMGFPGIICVDDCLVFLL